MSFEAGRMTLGKMILMGAGPGDPDLLTGKAVKALQQADIVLHDDLVSPGVLELVPARAERIATGKRGGKASWKQGEITALAISHALAGRTVVRLKGGDPMVFGRADEEISAAHAAGIALEIIPGVTAAFAAAASLQISLTKRDTGRRLQFITAHQGESQPLDALDLQSLVDPNVTSCVYMGVKTLPRLSAMLVDAGLSAQTPVAVVEKASQPQERILRGMIGTIAKAVVDAKLEGPCIILIGNVFSGH
jgi:uroporphyrin-III C-methyltransferase / precorrin-2 dehydrogenase / sirohydrochlorin ferrochelatase